MQKKKLKTNISIKNTLKRQNWKVIVLLVILIITSSTPIYFHRIMQAVDTDYGSHIYFAQDLLQGKTLEPRILAHPVLQLLLISIYVGSHGKINLFMALIIVQVAVQVALALILYFWFGESEHKHWDLQRAGLAFSMTFLAPVMLLAFKDQKFYYGYITLSNYHNPTIHLLKPFALLSFIYVIRLLSGEKSNWTQVFLSALWISLSTWIKPNYAFAILPALMLALVIRRLQHQNIDWRMATFGFFLPGFSMLLIQWWLAYVIGEPGESIVFAPFEVEGAFSDWLFVKFILSALFVLVVAMIARDKIFKDAGLLAGWSGFLVGATQFYLLAEGGERFMHGNFRWSGQIMLLLLFAASVRWIIQEKYLKGSLKIPEKIISYSAYFAHFIGGIVYYIYCFISIHYR